MDIDKEARRILFQGNGWGIKCADILELPENFRRSVWNRIVKIAEEENEYPQEA
jgi:hypothetical protein